MMGEQKGTNNVTRASVLAAKVERRPQAPKPTAPSQQPKLMSKLAQRLSRQFTPTTTHSPMPATLKSRPGR